MYRRAVLLASILGCVPLLVISSEPGLPAESESASQKRTAHSPESDGVVEVISSLRSNVGRNSIGSDHEFQEILSELIQKEASNAPSALESKLDTLPPDVDGTFDEILVERLRSTSELLEQKANCLENSQSYVQADEIRKLVKKMRRCARKLDLPKTAAPALLAPSPNLRDQTDQKK